MNWKTVLKGFVAAVFGGAATATAQTVLPKLLERKLSTGGTIAVAAAATGLAYLMDPKRKQTEATPAVPTAEAPETK